MDNDALIKRLGVLSTLPIASWDYPRILLGIPLERSMPYADTTFVNFMRIAAQGPHVIDKPHTRIDLIRNLMAVELLHSNFTHLLMLDADHKHPTDIIQRLAKWVVLFPQVRVVGGMNFRRRPPYDPVMGRVSNGNDRPIPIRWEIGLTDQDEVGGASILIHRSVFEELEPPWFPNDYSRVWENVWPGEDMGFCKKCREAGIPIYVDTTTVSPHGTEELVDEGTFRNYIATFPQYFREAPVEAQG